MRRYIIFLLITGIVWAQTEFDTLVLKDKIVYTGALIKFGNDEIMFKALLSSKWSKKLSVNISDIQELKLSDGTRVIENGIIVPTNEKHIKNISYDRYLYLVKTEKAKKRPQNIMVCCAMITILSLYVYYDFKKNFKIRIGGEFPTP